MNKKALFVNLLLMVPEPHVQAAAGVLKTLMIASSGAAAEAIDDTAAIDEAVAEAMEPWRRIAARAAGETTRD